MEEMRKIRGLGEVGRLEEWRVLSQFGPGKMGEERRSKTVTRGSWRGQRGVGGDQQLLLV